MDGDSGNCGHAATHSRQPRREFRLNGRDKSKDGHCWLWCHHHSSVGLCGQCWDRVRSAPLRAGPRAAHALHLSHALFRCRSVWHVLPKPVTHCLALTHPVTQPLAYCCWRHAFTHRVAQPFAIPDALPHCHGKLHAHQLSHAIVGLLPIRHGHGSSDAHQYAHQHLHAFNGLIPIRHPNA